MLEKIIIPDRSIDQKVSQQLANRGMRPPCKVSASSKGGTVTLTGKIQYEHQRNLCIQMTRRVEGVKRVVDQLQVIVKVVKKDRPWQYPMVDTPHTASFPSELPLRD
jgi:hypothetical protein